MNNTKKSTRFYTGELCVKGHVAERLVSSGECIDCKRERERRKYVEDGASYKSEYYKANKANKIAQQKQYDARRHGEKLEYGRQWRTDNVEQVKEYRRKNAGLYAFHTACRRKRVNQATPVWAELDKIKLLYIEAAKLGLQVDHIIPIAGKNVCGLHVLANLQLLTEEENRRKKNSCSLLSP